MKEFNNHPLLNFFDVVNLSTGEIKTVNTMGHKITPSKKAEYKGLIFKIYETGTIIISGSLHKYWNDGKHNYNDFGIQELVNVLKDLKTKFNLEPQHCTLKCVEIGINITPPIKTNQIIINCFMHKTTLFEYQKNSNTGKYIKAKHSQYDVKLYNKALQYLAKHYQIDCEIMRIEIKYTKMQKLNEKGIYTLSDLINYGLYNFRKELCTEWHNILFYDNTIQIDSLSTQSKNKILEYSNPNYWAELLNRKQHKNFTYHKDRLKQLTEIHSKNIKDQIEKLILEKVETLNPIKNDHLNIKSEMIVLCT